MEKGPLVSMLEEAWLVYTVSYEKETSPLEVKVVGILAVMFVGETAKREVPESVMLKMLPVVSPWAPMFRRTRSPEAVVGEEGSQLKSNRRPVGRAVEVDPMYIPVPVVRELGRRAMAEFPATPE